MGQEITLSKNFFLPGYFHKLSPAGGVLKGGFFVTGRLDVLLPTPLTGRGPSYTCGMIARSMAGAELSVTVVAPHARAYSIAPAEVFEIDRKSTRLNSSHLG